MTETGDYSGSDEEEHDAYLEQMKAEGAERNEDESDSEGGGIAKFWRRYLIESFYFIQAFVPVSFDL